MKTLSRVIFGLIGLGLLINILNPHPADSGGLVGGGLGGSSENSVSLTGSKSNGNILLYNSANQANTVSTFTMTSGGQVGIGTASPPELLSVNGTSAFSTDKVGYGIGLCPSSGVCRLANNMSGAQNALRTAGSFWELSDNSAYLRLWSGAIIGGLYNVGTVLTPLYVDTNGNVGISTTTPLQALHVVGNNARIRSDSTTGTSFIELYNQDTQASQRNWDMASNVSSRGNLDIRVGAAQGTAPSTNILTLTSAGSVGIGTSNPAVKLHISSGSILIDGTTTQPFRVGASSFIVTNAGNVGIGTISPAYSLDVTGTQRVTGLSIFQSSVTFQADYQAALTTTTFNATQTINWQTVGPITSITLTANITSMSFSGAAQHGRYTLILVQDGTGSRTVTWPTNIKWPNLGAAPTLTTTANARDYFTMIYDVDGNFHVLAEALNN